jgi:hypothetical protein
MYTNKLTIQTRTVTLQVTDLSTRQEGRSSTFKEQFSRSTIYSCHNVP